MLKANRGYLGGLKGTCSLELYMSGTSACFWNWILDLLTCKLRRGEYVWSYLDILQNFRLESNVRDFLPFVECVCVCVCVCVIERGEILLVSHVHFNTKQCRTHIKKGIVHLSLCSMVLMLSLRTCMPMQGVACFILKPMQCDYSVIFSWLNSSCMRTWCLITWHMPFQSGEGTLALWIQYGHFGDKLS